MDVPKIISNIKFNLLQNYCWYGHVLMQLPVVYDMPGVSTMAIGKQSRNDLLIKLFVNSEYVEHIFSLCPQGQSLAVAHLTEVLRHEIHHLIFGHLTMEFPLQSKGVIACELAANSYIVRSKLIPEKTGEKPGVFPEDYQMENGLPTWDYYTQLCKILPPDNSEQNQSSENSSSKGSGDSNAQGENNTVQNNSGSGRKQEEQGSDNGSGSGPQTLDSHTPWEAAADDPVSHAMIQDIICKANEACRRANDRWGNIPAGVKEAILLCEEIKEPVIPWEVVLKDFLASAAETVLDYTMRRPSKRYGTRPGTKKEDILSIAIGIDISGSIEHEMLQFIFNELEWIYKSGSKIKIFEWDTEIQREYDFRDFDNSIKKGGGTDPTDFLEAASSRKFDCAIIFTDLMFDPIEEDYKLPLLWVVLQDDELPSPLPVDGIVMRVNSTRDGFDVLRN